MAVNSKKPWQEIGDQDWPILKEILPVGLKINRTITTKYNKYLCNEKEMHRKLERFPNKKMIKWKI